jgi:hypothetical protein
MEIDAQESRLGLRSQVYAHGIWLTDNSAARCFDAQPVSAVFRAIKSPPDDPCGRSEQD